MDEITIILAVVGGFCIVVALYMMLDERKRRREDRRAGNYNRDAGGRFTAGDVSKEVPTIKKAEKQ